MSTLQKTEKNKQVAPQQQLRVLLNEESTRKRIESIIGEKKAGLFVSSILNVVDSTPSLSEADTNSIIKSAMVAATLELPIDKNLGFAWIVPFKGKAQFQIGYKGYVQLAQRSGQYLTINTTEVYEGEIQEYNRFTGEYKFDSSKKISDKIVGYYAYFKLINGFEKGIYWERERAQAHAARFSKSYNSDSSIWKSDFDAMAEKTLLKHLLSKWGILSVDMQRAIVSDQATIEDISKDENNTINITPRYVDNEEAQIKEIPDAAGGEEVEFEELLNEYCAEEPRNAKTLSKLQTYMKAKSGLTDMASRASLRDYREARKLPTIDWAAWWNEADYSDIQAFADYLTSKK